MNILQKIFSDHFEEIKYTLHPRDTELENIEKMINCGDPSYGGAMYGCLECGHLKFVPFRCHSRFCTTCGNLYARKRATAMAGTLVNCQHRHCVFTIPEELRHYFFEDRSLLDSLFDAVRSVVLRMFFNLNKSKNFVPGFICVLHTFGRPLTWNPHIHCLISEGGLSDDGTWRKVSYFNYTLLRNSFRTALLNLLEEKIGPSFKPVKSKMYRIHDKGFYVYAKPSLSDSQTITEYIGRYLGRPVIATKRIDEYNVADDTVTFHYNRHEDNAFVKKTLPTVEFIKLLIQHIPEKHFKMIRYNGLYARHRDIDKSLIKQRSAEKQRFSKSLNRWRDSILFSFGYDPLWCEKCKKEMTILEIVHKHEHLSLEELYEKVMRRHKPKQKSSA